MDRLFQEIVIAVNHGLYFVALIATLSVPDMCAGLERPDGRTTGPLYISWFDRWVAPRYGGTFIGTDCYGLRCSLLHEGRALPHQGLYTRAIFVEPSPIGVFHNNVLNDALNLDIPIFCRDVIEGSGQWLATVQGTPAFEANLEAFFSRHAAGLPPYIVGVPVYG
jgi:hypothetical protein